MQPKTTSEFFITLLIKEKDKLSKITEGVRETKGRVSGTKGTLLELALKSGVRYKTSFTEARLLSAQITFQTEADFYIITKYPSENSLVLEIRKINFSRFDEGYTIGKEVEYVVIAEIASLKIIQTNVFSFSKRKEEH